MIQYPGSGFLFLGEICCESHFEDVLVDRNTCSFVLNAPAVNCYANRCGAKRDPDITKRRSHNPASLHDRHQPSSQQRQASSINRHACDSEAPILAPWWQKRKKEEPGGVPLFSFCCVVSEAR